MRKHTRQRELEKRAEQNASETTKRMVQVAAVKAQVEAITRRLRSTVDELEEAVKEMPDEIEVEEGENGSSGGA
jgi:predicted phage gp36 major capsid-like protein